jgi:hypothetical protein
MMCDDVVEINPTNVGDVIIFKVRGYDYDKETFVESPETTITIVGCDMATLTLS